MTTLQDIAQNILSLPHLQDLGVPTASIAVLSDGKLDSHVLTSGPENTDTVYQAASISKAICALAVARLVDDGKLSYDTKVVDHLGPGLVDVIVGDDETVRAMMQVVTVRMLVSHTSGLSQHGFPGYGGEAATPADVVRGRCPANTPRMRFVSPPGSQCCYSGGGFVVLQLMLERIMGKAFAEIMHETVLKPLGMSRSWYGDLSSSETNFARAHFTAQTPAEPERGYNILPELAAAGLWTTPSDLLKAVLAIQDSPYSTSSGFLKQETAKALLTKVATSGSLGTAGLGWWLTDVGFGHSGDNWPGYNTYCFGFHGGANGDGDGKEQPRNGIAIMTNSVLGHATCVKQIVASIMYAKGWSGKVGGEEFVPYPAPASTIVDVGWKAWKGRWEGGWEILEHEGGPALKYAEFAAMKLRTAAAPVKIFEGGRKEIWLVVDRLSIGTRLTWSEEGKGEKVVRLQLEEERVLKREN